MAKRNIINGPIGDMTTPWDNGVDAYAGEAVEAFIKQQLTALSNDKIGFILPIVEGNKESDGFYHIKGFASESAYRSWASDPTENAALLIADIKIPISEEHGVSNVVTLTREGVGNVAISKKELMLTLSYLWRQYNPIGNETTTMEESATVTFDVRMKQSDGVSWGAWMTERSFTGTINSGETKTFDVSRLLVGDGTYQIRATALGEESGVSAQAMLTALYSDVTLSYEGSAAQVYTGDLVELPFFIGGSVPRMLNIRINGHTETYDLGTTANLDSPYYAECRLGNGYFSFSRGAVNVEAWVSFGDGYNYSTDVVRFQFIYIPVGDTSTVPIIAYNPLVTEFTNWTFCEVFKFGVYNPSSEKTDVRITLSDNMTYDTYLDETVECHNNEECIFSRNFAIESEAGIRAAKFGFAIGSVDYGGFNVSVDNRENFAATRGATFTISPERREIKAGEQSWELSKVIENIQDTNSGWRSVSETDSVGATVNVPVLRISSGNKVFIPYDAFDVFTPTNDGTTIEFDIRVSNIVNDSKPVIDMSVPNGNVYRGVRIYPTKAVCLTSANVNPDKCDVKFREDQREHIAINIVRNLRSEGINYVRIYMNGVCNREFVYKDNESFIGVSGGKGGFDIGCDVADVEVFGVRIYKGRGLSSLDIQNDYMAAMPSINDKRTFKKFNSIYNGTRILYDNCNQLGLNTLLRRIPEGGKYPQFNYDGNQIEKQKGVEVVVKIYSERGNPDSLDRRHSGTFHNMTIKGQGTTSMTYYWWNITDGFEDDKKITESEYNPSDWRCYIKDGEYFRKQSWFDSEDGHFTHVQEYEIEDGRGGITKLNGKANYASSSQSHKLGNIWLYDELWQRLVNTGNGSHPTLGTRPVLKGHACCYEKPFLNFYQIGSADPVFCGFQTWGSAKGDKKTFGYDKKAEPGYMCISGADNNSAMAKFQMPIMMVQNQQTGAWEGNLPYCNIEATGKNGYCYTDGTSVTLSFEVEIADKYDDWGEVDGIERGKDELKPKPEETLMKDFQPFTQFLCASSPLLKPFTPARPNNPAEEQLNYADNLDPEYQYWVTSGIDQYKVYYYNHCTHLWQECNFIPVAWGADGVHTSIGSMLITTQLAGMTVTAKFGGVTETKTLEEAIGYTNNVNTLTEYLSQARVEYFRTHAFGYMDKDDAVFHQAWARLEAATDNRAKNIYPWIRGRYKVDGDNKVDRWVRFKQDDTDTVKPTDNEGQSTKPYHILEHSIDPASGTPYWNAENSVLFTLIERAWDSDIRTMMNRMFNEMRIIAISVSNYYDQRFFWVQRYFPASAYNETNRLLYEKAKVIYDSNEGGLKNFAVDPITQAMGDQLEAEQQFVKQRLAMLQSWCGYENESGSNISWRSAARNMGGGVMNNNVTYIIPYTAYQYIYPRISSGNAQGSLQAFINNEWVDYQLGSYRCAPGETVRLIVTTGTDQLMNIPFCDYATEIGNLGDCPAWKDDITIRGKRLRKVDLSVPEGSINQLLVNVNIATRNAEEVIMTGCSAMTGSFDAELPRCKKLLLEGTNYGSVEIPKTSALTTLALPATLQRLEMRGIPSLREFSIEGVANLSHVLIDCDGIDTLEMVSNLRQAALDQAAAVAAGVEGAEVKLHTLSLLGIDWDGVGTEILMWAARMTPYSYGASSERYALTGHAFVDQSIKKLTSDYKRELITLYGNIDAPEGSNVPLRLTYDKYQINSISISGPSYIKQAGTVQYGMSVTPVNSNNIAIVTEPDGTVHEDVRFSFIDVNGHEIVPPLNNTWEDAIKGLLNVRNIVTEATGSRYTLRCTVNTVVGNSIRTLTSDILVGFYLRHPKVGDFAYADGTFDDKYQKDKTLVGIAYKLDPMYQGDDDAEPITYTGFNKPSEQVLSTKRLVGYRVLIDCKENAVIKSTDNYINTSSNAWGLYPEGSTALHSTNGFGSTFGTKVAGEVGLTSIFDTDMVNITGRDLTGGNHNDYLETGNVYDSEQDDGFKDYSSKSGMINDWNGINKTKIIVRHMEKIFNNYLMGGNNDDIALTWNENVDGNVVRHTLSELPTTLEELGNAMEILEKANGNLGIFRQFMYPAAYSCYLYEPKLKEGETLDPQYARNNWYLPAMGELCRMFVFFAKSRTGGFGANYTEGQNTLPNRSVIDNMILAAYNSETSNQIKSNVSLAHINSGEYTNAEINAINKYFNALPEAQRPIYSLILWRAAIANGGSPFASRSASHHWSSTEFSPSNAWGVYFINGNSYYGNKFNNNVVRPSVAYSFSL